MTSAEIGIKVIPFNHRMRAARRELGLSQRALAECCGLSWNTISRVERLNKVTEPTAKKIALGLGYDVEWLFPLAVRQIHTQSAQSVEFVMELESFDLLSEEDCRQLLIEGPQEQVEIEALHTMVRELVDQLPEREAAIVRLRYGLIDGAGHTLEEVGCTFGITKSRVRQIEQKALRRLGRTSNQRQLERVGGNLWKRGGGDE